MTATELRGLIWRAMNDLKYMDLHGPRDESLASARVYIADARLSVEQAFKAVNESSIYKSEVR